MRREKGGKLCFKRGAVIWWAVAIGVLLGLLALCFWGRSCGRLNGSESLSVYRIDASYDGERGVTAEMNFGYVNGGDGAAERLYFHLYPAAFREGAQFGAIHESNRADAYPEGESFGGIEIESVSGELVGSYEVEGQDEDILCVELSRAVEPTEGTEILIKFSLEIPIALHRFGASEGRVNLGNWYPVLCESEGGTVDTSPYYDVGDPFYSAVADYEVCFSAPSGYDVITSGEEVVENGENCVRVTAKGAKMRDFAVVIGKFDSIEREAHGVKIRYFFVSDGDSAARVQAAADAIATFSDLFGAYPYPSLDVVESGLFYGGMEYPALVMVSFNQSDSLRTEAVIHETAHQWWYAVVGSNQVASAWLDEGLAEYSTTLFYEKNPSYGVTRQARIADAAGSYMVYLSSTADSSTAMNRRLPDFPTPTDYAFLSYVKGALMLDSLRSAVGDQKFFDSLRAYYDENAFSIATPDHFIGAFERFAGVGVGSFIRCWIDGREVECQ